MKLRLYSMIFSALLLAGICTMTSPVAVPAFLLVVPFMALFVLLVAIILHISSQKGWSRTRRYRVAGIGAGVPVMLLVLQSIGQLTMRDLATIGAIFIVLHFYLSRLSFAE